MPTVNTGVVDDKDILQNERIVDMSPEIAQLEKDMTQFTTMLMRARSRPARSSIVEWLEDELFPRRDTTAASATSAAASITVSNTDYFRQWDVVRVATTGEGFIVASAPASSSIATATRGLGDTSAVSIASGAELIIIGNAAAQGATLGARAVTERTHQHNYTEIFRHPYTFTNTLKASALYGQDDAVSYERRKKAVEHKRAIEYSVFLGVRNNDTSGSEPRGTMGGVDDYISTHDTDVGGGAMTKIELDNFMRGALQHSRQPVLFVSPIYAQQLGQFVSSDYRVNVGQAGDTSDELLGVRVSAYLSSAYADRVPIITKRDWNDFTAGNQYGFNGLAFAVDMDEVFLRPLRPTALLLERQANDEDSTTEEYLSELSLEVRQEKHHGRHYGITSVS